MYPERPGGLFRGAIGKANRCDGKASVREKRTRRATAKVVRREDRGLGIVIDVEGMFREVVSMVFIGSSSCRGKNEERINIKKVTLCERYVVGDDGYSIKRIGG